MAKQAKAKTTKGERNSDRKNGKANKKNPGQTHNHGRKMSQGELIRMGKGLYQSWPVLGHAERSRPATSDSDD
jgi:hypothetical protein